MKQLFHGIIMLLMMSFAHANDIYVTQSGATLDLDITQDGQDNKVGNHIIIGDWCNIYY